MVPGRWSVVGVTVVGGLWSVAGRWAVVLYYAFTHVMQLAGKNISAVFLGVKNTF